MYSYSTELSFIDELGVVVIPAVQGDTKRVFKFSTDLDLDSGNYTGQIDVLKNPDESAVTYLCEIKDNCFVIDTSNPDNAAFLSTAGTIPAQLSVTDVDNGGSITTWEFKLQIQTNIFSTSFPEDSSLIDKVKNLVSKAISVCENAVQNFIKSKNEALRAQSYATGDATKIDVDGNPMVDAEGKPVDFRVNQSTDNAKYYSEVSKSYADGTGTKPDGTPIRDSQNTENAKSYMEKAIASSTAASNDAKTVAENTTKVTDSLKEVQRIQEYLGGKLLQMKGTISFADLAKTSLESNHVGYMYNIKDGFLVDERFVEYDPTKPADQQAKKQPGTNVYMIEVINPTTLKKEYKWDVMTGLSYWVGTDKEYQDLIKANKIEDSILYFTTDNDDGVPSGNVKYNGNIDGWKTYNLNQILAELSTGATPGTGGSSDPSQITYANESNPEWNGKSLKEIIDIIYDAVDNDHKIYKSGSDIDFSSITTTTSDGITFNDYTKVNVCIDGNYFLASEYSDYAFFGNLTDSNGNIIENSEEIERILFDVGNGLPVNNDDFEYIKPLIFYQG